MTLEFVSCIVRTNKKVSYFLVLKSDPQPLYKLRCSKSFPLDASSKITLHLIFHLTKFYKTLLNMKLAIATSLFASAAAFAPSASKVRKLTWADSC